MFRISPRHSAALALLLVLGGAPFGLKAHAMSFDSSDPGNWWAANAQQIAAAPCRHTTPMTNDELLRAVEDLGDSQGQTMSRTIRGVRFENESPILLTLFDQLTNGSAGSSYSVCTKVICAAQQIFGARAGLQLLFLLARYGYNGSHLAYPGSRAWTSQELDDILIALADYPETVLPIVHNQPLIHLTPPGQPDRCNKMVANATIAVTYLWDTHPHEEKESTIFHEVAHGFGLTGADSSQDWASFSGWHAVSTRELPSSSADGCPAPATFSGFDVTRPETLVSEYAHANPFEDFAESVVAYRYAPQKLKNASPEKYEFLKEVIFDGLEYTSERACDPASSYTATKLETRIRRELEQGVGDDVIDAVYRECSKPLHDVLNMGLVPRNLDPESRQCVSRELSKAVALKVARAKEFKYAQYALRSIETRNFQPPSEEALEDAARRIRHRLHDEIVDDVLRQDQFMHFRYQDFDSPAPREFCGYWSSALGDQNTSQIRDVLTDICVRVQSQYDRRQPMKSRHVKSAVDSYFP